MAVSSSPAAANTVAAADPQRNNELVEVKMVDRSEIRVEQVEVAQSDGNRVEKGARNGGKACHQCRQKIMVKSAACKNMKTDKKQCPLKFCEKCLINRYGEKVEEKEGLDNWECPKCRGICNCSQCMRKKGLKPTGILVHAAKKAGFSSVSLLLDAKGPEPCPEMIMRSKIAVSEGTVSSSDHKAKLEGLRENAEVPFDNDATNSPPKLTDEPENEKKTKTKARKLDATMNDHDVEVVLPRGTLLTSASGIDLLPEEVGYSLQFLEFCSTFGEVLGIRRGQPECVLRDITSERGRRKGIYSSAIQFLILLLSFILKDEEEVSPASSITSENDSWIHFLKKCISQSNCDLVDIPINTFEQGFDGYEMLDNSQKLKLLTFLCDETLCTIEMRNWIDDQHHIFVTKVKEAKKTLSEAKEREKEANLKLVYKVAKEGTAENEDLNTNSEHDSKVSEIEAEAEQARREIVEAKDSVPKMKQISDALRTQPILLADKGHVFWRLKCLTDSELLCQVIEDPSYQPVSNENWFIYNAEEKILIENHISSGRLKRRRLCVLDDPSIRMKNSDLMSEHEVDSSSNDESSTPPNVEPVSAETCDDSTTPTVNC